MLPRCPPFSAPPPRQRPLSLWKPLRAPKARDRVRVRGPVLSPIPNPVDRPRPLRADLPLPHVPLDQPALALLDRPVAAATTGLVADHVARLQLERRLRAEHPLARPARVQDVARRRAG